MIHNLFIVIFIAISAVMTRIICSLWRPLDRNQPRGLTVFERILALVSSLFATLGLIIILSKSGVNVEWVYRDPLFYLPWRFAIAYLVGIPIARAIRNYPEPDTGPTPKPKSHIIINYIIMVMVCLFLLPVTLITFGFQSMFGYGPALFYNPLQVLVPFVAACSLHLYFSRSFMKRTSGRLRAGLIAAIPFWIVMVTGIISLVAMFRGPTSYDWYGEYLSKKYGVEVKMKTLSSMPQPVPVVEEQDTPSGLVLRYLCFGERAVDYSVLND